MIDLDGYEKGWVHGWIKGILIAYVRGVISNNGNSSIDNAKLVKALGLPKPFLSAVIDAYSSGTIDPKKIVEQLNIESEAFKGWHEATFREGVGAYIEYVCNKRFGELPGWVLNKLKNAQDEELEDWLDGLNRYCSLEEIFLGFELGQQILQKPPDSWQEAPFNNGMRRALRVQLHEKFGDLPFWVDQAIYNLKYDQLLQLSRTILHAENIDCLLKKDRVELEAEYDYRTT